MGKAATNLSVVLGLVTIVFAGYWFYISKDSATLNSGGQEQTKEAMLQDTQKFEQHSQILREIKLETSIFEDARFKSLRTFTTDIRESNVGRNDPFAEPVAGNNPQP